MTYRFTNEEIAMLAEQERRMDSGEQPFVVADDSRLAVMPEVMDEFGLVSGQTVTWIIVQRILECQLAIVSAKAVLQSATNSAPEGKG